MLPSKRLTPEDVFLILRRRIWLILLPLAVVSAVTAVVARHLPNRYRSETVILVVPQRVPETYVKATVTARIEDRLQSISQQILSRTRLERIIQDFNLYAAQRQTGTMENIVERMRFDIDVQVVKSDAFRVAYVGDDARTVMQVTSRLASLFIEENLRDREVLAEGTNRFLEAQVEDTRRQLIQHEKKLEEYRKRFSGELPSQLPANLQIIQNIQMQIQALVESINRDRDRRLLVERLLHDTEREIQTSDPARVAASPVDVASLGAPNETASQKLASAQTQLAALESRLRPSHPDVQRMLRLIGELQQQVEAETRDSPVDSKVVSTEPLVPPSQVIKTERVSDLRAELEQLDRQLEFKNAEHQRLRALTDSYQQRVESQPTRESELAELTRDYSTLQTLYAALLTKQEESKIAANLERRQVGEQFKLLDPARIAENPFSPNRRRMTLLGMAAGLALGLGLVALLEYNDRAFKTDTELAKELALPVLAVVPMMVTHSEERRAFWRRVFLGCGLGTIVAACLSVVAYTLLL